MKATKPLDGVLVTELGMRRAVAICGSLLAQLGATVVAVETFGDGADRANKAAHRQQFAAGKLSFVPKHGHKADEELLAALAARSDIVLTSSDVDRPLIRHNHDRTPRNVACDITAFGTTGPFAARPYTEFQLQALTGLMDTTGFDDGPPVAIGIPLVEYLSGTYAAAAVLAALRVKRQQDAGQFVEISLFDCAIASLGPFLTAVLAGGTVKKSRIGNRHPSVAPWNLFPSKDGWILICAGNQAQWVRLCALVERPDLSETFVSQAQRLAGYADINPALEAWTKQHTTDECVRQLCDAMVACGPIAPIEDYPREPNLDYREMIRRIYDENEGRDIFIPSSPLRMSASPGQNPEQVPALDSGRTEIARIQASKEEERVPSPRTELDRPLSGMRIIEIGQYTTAPLCARQLAHFGAEVIKIEQPGGDESRTWPPTFGGRGISYRLNNADKRSFALDLRTEAGKEALKRLIKTADVLVENLKPGALAKFGLSPDEILRINPRLVYCAISGFGAHSLYAQRPAFDTVIQAMSGFMSAVCPGETPLKSGISTADGMGAEIAIVAILGALEYRDRTGAGQYIDLSMQDVSCWLTQTVWNGNIGHTPRPQVMHCADGYLVVDATDIELSAALNRAACSREKLAELTREQAASVLSSVNLAAAPILTVREASAFPQTHERRLWFTVEEDGFAWPLLSSPMRLHATPPRISRTARVVNEDGPAILKELGLPPQA